MYGTVTSTQQLSAHMVRVVLGGDGLADFPAPPDTDAYINAMFLPEQADYTPPFQTADVSDLPPSQRPFPRRISVRSWDPHAQELTLEIAVHGDTGYAGRWASAAAAGDRLQFKGPSGGYRPHADADWYLFVGDESAYPAIAASAEAVSSGKPVVTVVEVDGPDDELPLSSPGDLQTVWVHRGDRAGDDLVDLLADAVRNLEPLEGQLSAFVHGEAQSIREVRRHLLTNSWVTDEYLSCSPYWHRGHTDEQWRLMKKQWLQDLQDDAPPMPPPV